MKQIFFGYPGGLAGVALLLLRMSVALSLVIALASAFSPDAWVASLLYLLAITIVFGLSTRIAAALCATACVLLVWPAEFVPPLPTLINILDAAALALIGPGAFSIDARLFGRRTMRLPDQVGANRDQE